MSVEPALLLFAGVVFLSYGVQTVAGFGSMLICVTLGAHLLEIRDLLTLAVPISILQTSYIVLRHYDKVDVSLYFKRILPLMATGTLIGFLGIAGVSGPWLRIAFGAMAAVR